MLKRTPSTARRSAAIALVGIALLVSLSAQAGFASFCRRCALPFMLVAGSLVTAPGCDPSPVPRIRGYDAPILPYENIFQLGRDGSTTLYSSAKKILFLPGTEIPWGVEGMAKKNPTIEFTIVTALGTGKKENVERTKFEHGDEVPDAWVGKFDLVLLQGGLSPDEGMRKLQIGIPLEEDALAKYLVKVARMLNKGNSNATAYLLNGGVGKKYPIDVWRKAVVKARQQIPGFYFDFAFSRMHDDDKFDGVVIGIGDRSSYDYHYVNGTWTYGHWNGKAWED